MLFVRLLIVMLVALVMWEICVTDIEAMFESINSSVDTLVQSLQGQGVVGIVVPSSNIGRF